MLPNAHIKEYTYRIITYTGSNPIQIDYYVGGTWDSGTATWSGGTLKASVYLYYTGSNVTEEHTINY